MLQTLCSLVFMLAQNETEKSLTILGLTLFGGFMFFLILDSLIKGKWVPKKGPTRGFLIFIFIMVIIALIFLFIYYK